MRNMLPRIAKIAPLSSCRFKSKIAPRTIYRIEAAVTRPSREAAAIWRNGTFQTAKASTQVIAYATGMALVAGHLKRTMSPKTVMIGRRASRASIPKLKSKSFVFVVYPVMHTNSLGYIMDWNKFPDFIKHASLYVKSILQFCKGKISHIVLKLKSICLLQKDRLYSSGKRMNGVYEINTAAEQDVC
jgi:hypothetical protein